MMDKCYYCGQEVDPLTDSYGIKDVVFHGSPCFHKEPHKEILHLTTLLNEALTNDYCDMHKSPQDGEGCPVCLGIERREGIITRWTNDRKRLNGLLRECEVLADIVADCRVPEEYESNQAQLLRPKLAEFKEKPADDRNDPLNLRHNDW